jgi:hypothetical protein
LFSSVAKDVIWPDEPENLDLTELREIRAELEKLHGLERRFDALDKRFDEMRAYVYCSLGLGTVK